MCVELAEVEALPLRECSEHIAGVSHVLPMVRTESSWCVMSAQEEAVAASTSLPKVLTVT